MTPHALLFTLAAIGISETAYLIKKRRKLEQPFCPLGENCAQVLGSRYNKIFFVHNDILGLAFYIAISFITALLVLETQPPSFWEPIAKISILGGTVFSVFLTYLQWKVIKSWCTWCLISALTVFLMTLIILTATLKTG